MNPQTTLGIALAVLAVAAGGWFIYADIASFSEPKEAPIAEQKERAIAYDESEISGGEVGEATGSAEMVMDESVFNEVPGIPPPSVNRPIVFSDAWPEDAQAAMTKNITLLADELRKNPDLFSKWLNIGILWKQIGDYEGARLAWEYASALRPADNVAYHNLGDLYHYYLKDYPKAETNFEQAIVRYPTYIPTYLAFHELYRYSYRQNTTRAVDVLNDALAQSPNNANVFSAFAQYYLEKDDDEHAREYFIKARDAAEAEGNDARAELFQEEIDSL